MSEFERLRDVVAQLRGEHGCPWDREQTHGSLKATCIEEAAEVIGGINILEETGNSDNLREELGDLLLQVVMNAQIAEEEGFFTMDDVSRTVIDKLVRRHPHVFGNSEFTSPEEAKKRWEEIKKTEKDGREWEQEYLPAAMDEAKQLIDVARKRKGFVTED